MLRKLRMLIREPFSDYPQTWYYMPSWLWLRLIFQRVHGWLGHEASKTEWGYAGGEFVDSNCRWCDAPLQIPADRAHFHFGEFHKYRHLMRED